MALNRPAKMSSMAAVGRSRSLPACGAVNGRMEAVRKFAGSPEANCILTDMADTRPWLEVDLEWVYYINHIVIVREASSGEKAMMCVCVRVCACVCVCA